MSNSAKATLSNGVRVANFSSPHPFKFTDGSVLEAVPSEVSQLLSMNRQEVESEWPGLPGVLAVRPCYTLTSRVLARLEALHAAADVDVVIVPFPMLEALKEQNLHHTYPKAATVLLADRVAKTCCIDRFCR